MNPYLIIAALVGAIALAGGAYWKGWSDRAARAEVATSKVVEQSHQQAVSELTAANVPAAKLEQTNAQEKIVYRTITQQVDRIVDRPVYRDRCIDDDGLRIARAAIAGAPTAAAEPDGAMPGPAAPR